VSDFRIAQRRLKAFCNASGFAEDDIIMSHSAYNENLTVKGKVNLVFGDIKTLLNSIDLAEQEINEFQKLNTECANENERLRAALEEIDSASQPEQGLMAWVHDRTQKALKGGKS
jgi:hypothetical protein|tara:strand:- start:34481 stop:34825 length:345 start_codon:yes stop_codon:yes gene_type:complete